MRIAIFHNYLDNIGGAELVTLTLARELGADVYTTVADQENIRRMGFDIPVHTIGWIPRNAPWRQQLASLRFRLLNVADQYDYFIIAGDWAISGAVRHKPNLWYVHSPKREFWDLHDYTRNELVPDTPIIRNLKRYIFDIWAAYNRFLDRTYIKHVQKLVCNSKNVQDRIKKFLAHDATVIHPPVDTDKFYFGEVGNYWLSVNRLISPKRIELQLDAFRTLPTERLTIVGSYERSEHFLSYKRYLERIKPENVTLRSHVTFDELVELYANCKGFITTAMDEDFGMTPVEAMAAGKPVIAGNEGGYTETVIDGETGILIDDIDEHKLADAIQRVGAQPERYRAACQKRAQDFDTSVFIAQIKQEIGL